MGRPIVVLLRCSGSPPWRLGGGRQWIALLYTHSSRRCAAPRLLSPKPSRGSHRPRLNSPSRTWAPNPLSRLGRPLQGVATQDGWTPAERPCPPLGFFRKRQNSERPAAGRRIYSPAQTHLRTHGAMIGKESPGLDGGMGVPRPGPALGEERSQLTTLTGVRIGPEKVARIGLPSKRAALCNRTPAPLNGCRPRQGCRADGHKL